MQELALEAYTLMHLADTAFPTGGFAFSQGLESMGKSGHLKSENDLYEYLLSQLKTVCEFELPFINSSYALYDDFDNNTLLSMTNEWEAFNTVESIRKASEILGENWFSLIKSAYKPNDIEELEQQFRSRSLPKYFQIVLPLLLRRIGFERTAIQRLVLYMALRDQFSAGIRLGLIGPLRAQALHVIAVKRVFPVGLARTQRSDFQANMVTDAKVVPAIRRIIRRVIVGCRFRHLGSITRYYCFLIAV